MLEALNGAPSAFIEDPEIMEYLIRRWKEYAKKRGRNYRTSEFGTLSSEAFDFDPAICHKDPRLSFLPNRYTLIDQEVQSNTRSFSESAEKIHGVNFFNEIQRTIDERKSNNETRPVSILITGSDVGFLNDELRAKFGNQVNVCGTTIELSRAKMRKKRIVESIKNGNIILPSELKEYLSTSLSDKIDPRDAKWRSILQIQSSKPEFDIIIDTYGELLYSYDKTRPEIFEMIFEACIAKLNKGGKLYIARLNHDTIKFIEKYCKEHGLILEKSEYKDRKKQIVNNFIIIKPI